MKKSRPVSIAAKRLVKIGSGVYGLPDGSVLIRRGRSRQGPQVQVEGDRPTALGAGEFVWDNPPGPTQGVTFGLRSGEQYIDAKGFVTPTQASRLLNKSRVWIYRLIRTGKLRSVKKPGTTAMVIPLSQIKRLLGTGEARVRPVCPGALWGYDAEGQPWLLG
jgi:hypothetical protein